MTIANYLIRTFDTTDRFGLRNGDWICDEAILSIIITNLGQTTTMMMMLDFNAIGNGTGPLVNIFDGPELREVLTVDSCDVLS